MDVFLELQSTHDLLSTIQRDLSAYPPDMSKLDTELKAFTKRKAELEKTLTELTAKRTELLQVLAQAEKFEESARTSLKAATQKVQYAAAIRDLDDRERQRSAVQRPLKEAEARIAAIEKELAEDGAKAQALQTQFDEFKAVFLSEHETQVEAQARLTARMTELEATIPAQDLKRFNRILQQRNGRAVVPFENGICTGCRTRIRLPMVTEIRTKGVINCESCQRILYDPSQHEGH